MTVLSNQPSNVNPLHQQGARLVLKRAPHLVFFLQEVVTPAIQIQTVAQTSPLDEMPWPGDRIYREPLRFKFQVDENLRNYLEIMEWIIKLAAPDSYSQYASLSLLDRIQRLSGDGVFSDLTVTVTNSLYNPNVEFRFQDAFPVGLGGIRFASTDDSPKMLTAECEFRFRHFTVHAADE